MSPTLLIRPLRFIAVALSLSYRSRQEGIFDSVRAKQGVKSSDGEGADPLVEDRTGFKPVLTAKFRPEIDSKTITRLRLVPLRLNLI